MPTLFLCPQLFLLVCVHCSNALFTKLESKIVSMTIFAETARQTYASPFPAPTLKGNVFFNEEAKFNI